MSSSRSLPLESRDVLNKNTSQYFKGLTLEGEQLGPLSGYLKKLGWSLLEHPDRPCPLIAINLPVTKKFGSIVEVDRSMVRPK